MQRPIWNGDISFGLVTIPVSVFSTEENNDLHFHLLDSHDHARIRYQRINSETGKEVAWNDLVKGYEYEKNQYLVVDENAFEKASPEVFKSIDIEEFIDLKEIDQLYYYKPYFITPSSKNKKAYVILREALKKTQKVGIAKILMRTKEYLSLIVPHDHALLLFLLHFKEDIRQESDLDVPDLPLKSYKINAREIKMAEQLIESMTEKWAPEKYHNTYRDVLKRWIDKQLPKTKSSRKKTIKSTQKDVVDFVALLKKSLKKNAVKPVKSN